MIRIRFLLARAMVAREPSAFYSAIRRDTGALGIVESIRDLALSDTRFPIGDIGQKILTLSLGRRSILDFRHSRIQNSPTRNEAIEDAAPAIDCEMAIESPQERLPRVAGPTRHLLR